MMYSRELMDNYTSLDIPVLKHFSSFLFSFAFPQKYVEVVTDDFTMYLIILKWP